MRVVVVGYGMVGARFVEELGRRGEHAVTVLGAEEYEPYNRVLLSEVVAGTVEVASLALPGTEAADVDVRRGTPARAIDRERRTVRTDDGDVPYDHLVLATGARARIPAAVGSLPPGVHALRTLDDAREIVAATVNRPRAVVLGGGVLGLEAACGLARRGLEVTVVHAGPHLMDRQLDAAAGAAVAHGLTALGIGARLGARTEGVDLRDGRLAGVRLSSGGDAAGGDGPGGDEVLPAGLLVLTAGTAPATELAAAAGLEVRRGVVVDADGATADPHVHAIGDCAEPPEGGTGLVAQGWDQARRLAAVLADDGTVLSDHGAAPAGDGRRATDTGAGAAGALHGTDVVRLKAHGIEVAAMGGTPQGARRVVLSDPSSGRHVAVTVAGGVVVGATCVGAGPLAADLTAAYTRRTPAPSDPAQLLVRPVRGAAAAGPEPSPTLMPDRATVCRCNGVTKGEVVACWEHGARSVAEVARATRATTGCGGCRDAVCGLVDWLAKASPATPREVARPH